MRLTNEVELVGSGRTGIRLTDPYDCHVYLLDGGGELALVDCGAGMGVERILANVRESGRDASKIGRVFATHAHADHVGGAYELRERTGGRVCVSSVEADYLERGDEDATGLSRARPNGFYPSDYRLKACAVDVRVEDGREFDVGKLRVRAIHTPGHSEGSVCYLVTGGERRMLFSGDAVFCGGRIMLLNCVGSSLADYRENLKKLSGLGVEALFPGHRRFVLKGGQEDIDSAVHALAHSLWPPPNPSWDPPPADAP